MFNINRKNRLLGNFIRCFYHFDLVNWLNTNWNIVLLNLFLLLAGDYLGLTGYIHPYTIPEEQLVFLFNKILFIVQITFSFCHLNVI